MNCGLISVGSVLGVGFPAKTTATLLEVCRINSAVTFTTGLKVDLMVSDDVRSPGQVGQTAVFGVTIGPTSTSTTLDETASGALASSTEVTGTYTVTAASAAGKPVVVTISLPAADLNSLAAGSWCLVRIRRLGANASDNHQGQVVLLAIESYDY